jgi:hypothetical protein
MLRILVAVALVAPAACLGTFAWRVCGRYGEVCSEAGRFFPVHDSATGRISFVMHDFSGNGIVDTWVYLKDDRITAVEIDKNEDGVTDERIELDTSGVAHVVEASSTEPEAAAGPPKR